MGQARTNARRRRQAKMGFTHLAKRKRPHYRHRQLESIGAAIEAERRKAARMAASKKSKK